MELFYTENEQFWVCFFLEEGWERGANFRGPNERDRVTFVEGRGGRAIGSDFASW